MTEKQRVRWFISAICFQLTLVGGLGLWKQSLVWRGRYITLLATPNAPWDPLRGDYIALEYSVGQVSDTLLGTERQIGQRGLKIGDVVYVSLVRDGTYWRAFKASQVMPTDGIFLRGRIENIELNRKSGMPSLLHLSFGIESWFVQRGNDSQFENAQRGSRPLIAATVSVTPEGIAILRRAKLADNQGISRDSRRTITGQTP